MTSSNAELSSVKNFHCDFIFVEDLESGVLYSGFKDMFENLDHHSSRCSNDVLECHLPRHLQAPLLLPSILLLLIKLLSMALTFSIWQSPNKVPHRRNSPAANLIKSLYHLFLIQSHLLPALFLMSESFFAVIIVRFWDYLSSWRDLGLIALLSPSCWSM